VVSTLVATQGSVSACPRCRRHARLSSSRRFACLTIQMVSLSSAAFLGYRLDMGKMGIFVCLLVGLTVGVLGNFLVFSRSPMRIVRTSSDLPLDQAGLLDLAEGITAGVLVVYDPGRSREVGLEFRSSRASLIILAAGVNSVARLPGPRAEAPSRADSFRAASRSRTID
jgi:hypothetical protein